MPNTEVKLTNAESTWPEAAREDRKLLIKEKTLTNVGVFFFICRGFLSGRVARDRRRTSFEGAKGRAKDSETATQRRDRKLLIRERTCRDVSPFYMHKFERE